MAAMLISSLSSILYLPEENSKSSLNCSSPPGAAFMDCSTLPRAVYVDVTNITPTSVDMRFYY